MEWLLSALGICAGASAAFPPVFPPVRIPRRHYRFPRPVYGESPLPAYPFVPLTDGEVYNNMPVKALIKRIGIPGLDKAPYPAEFLVVSDGGAHPNLRLHSSGLSAISEALLLYRVDEIARDQVTALRTRSIVIELIQRNDRGSSSACEAM